MRYINFHHILCTLLLLTSSTIVYAQGKVALGLEVEPKGSATITCIDEQGHSYKSWEKVPEGTKQPSQQPLTQATRLTLFGLMVSNTKTTL